MHPRSLFFSTRRSPSALSLWLTFFLLAFLCVDIALGSAVLRERQDGGTTEDDRTASVEDDKATSTRTLATVSGRTTLRATATSTTNTSTTAPSMTGTLTDGGSVPTLITDSVDKETDPDTIPVYSGVGLPISPKVTPGIAVAGVILMLTGIPFCLIGIKKQKIQIFLSVAYLSALGVTVLIVYVMNPPVKDAIQGAYVIASTITGLLFGAVAVIFPEVTETLGCLLGGYCLSMWFLVLKPGGLIDNTYGKLIMIAVFSIAVFGLAFYRVTKPYTLIVATSFSGATSIVLGIDCFSRAGLKEFWLYIWNLNESIFPLETNTYPHTRGMRVEIAIILLITIFGIMSQMKLWKILKERREQKRRERLKAQEDVEKLNEDVGRRVEEQDREERAQWEKIYGNAAETETAEKGSRPDSGVASGAYSRTTSMEDDCVKGNKEINDGVETKEMEQEGDEHIEMAGLQVEGKDAVSAEGEGQVVIPEQEEQPPPFAAEDARAPAEGNLQQYMPETQGDSQTPPTSETQLPPPPPILIRQHIPYIPDEKDEEDAMSLATYADTIGHSAHLEELTKYEPAQASTCAEEVISVQAGAAEPDSTDKRDSSDDNVDGSGTEKQNIVDTTNTLSPQNEKAEEILDSRGTDEASPDNKSCHDPKVSSVASEEHQSSSIHSEERKMSSVGSAEKTSSAPPSLAELNNLQNHCSRIHKTYRTNEWAKHLADAELLELDDLNGNRSLDDDVPDESPAPVLVTELAPTASIDARSQPPSRTMSRMSFSEQPTSGTPTRAHTPLSFGVLHAAPATPSSSPPPPPQPPTQNPPVSMSIPLRPALKPSSVPVISEGEITATEKPTVQHSPSPPVQTRAISPTPLIPYTTTLIGKRESMLKSRPALLAQEQIMRAASPSGFHKPVLGDTASVLNVNQLSNNDDIPLSERRDFLRSHQAAFQSQRPHTPMPSFSPRNSYGFNPPSPTAAKQTHLLQNWRESLRQDPHFCQQQENSQVQRKAMVVLSEKQQAALHRKEKETEKAQRDALIEERMRRPDMLNAHREAMRKLQAKASTT
ncbi:hypothetical protein BDZ91DRAFT_301482 [Kalaharituber pfeilii]|nr:hypothetical protein BDZ91DRAFT_301482 [Kalaharituber pfeilii]